MKRVAHKLYLTGRTITLLFGLAMPLGVIVSSKHDLVANDRAEACLKRFATAYDYCGVTRYSFEGQTDLWVKDTWVFHSRLLSDPRPQNQEVRTAFWLSLFAFVPLLLVMALNHWVRWLARSSTESAGAATPSPAVGGPDRFGNRARADDGFKSDWQPSRAPKEEREPFLGGRPLTDKDCREIYDLNEKSGAPLDQSNWTPEQLSYWAAWTRARAERMQLITDALQLLGWDGEKIPEDTFKAIRKKAMSLWHPDKQASYVSETGKSADSFDAMSKRVLAALDFLEREAVISVGKVVGW